MDQFDAGSTFSLAQFFAAGTAVDIALVIVVLEAGALWLWHRFTGRGLPPIDLVGFLGAGFCLLLALRLTIGQAWWGLPALCLTAAFACHAVDIWRRVWRRREDRL